MTWTNRSVADGRLTGSAARRVSIMSGKRVRFALQPVIPASFRGPPIGVRHFCFSATGQSDAVLHVLSRRTADTRTVWFVFHPRGNTKTLMAKKLTRSSSVCPKCARWRCLST